MRLIRPLQFDIIIVSRVGYIARKCESVGRNKFVNVMYEYHYKLMNIIIRVMNFIRPTVSQRLWLAKR